MPKANQRRRFHSMNPMRLLILCTCLFNLLCIVWIWFDLPSVWIWNRRFHTMPMLWNRRFQSKGIIKQEDFILWIWFDLPSATEGKKISYKGVSIIKLKAWWICLRHMNLPSAFDHSSVSMIWFAFFEIKDFIQPKAWNRSKQA